MLFNKHQINGNHIISEKAVRLISTTQVPESIMPFNERWSRAYGIHFWIDPVNSIAAVYMKKLVFDGGSDAKYKKQSRKRHKRE